MNSTPAGRALRVLGRFPRHLEAYSPGKLLAHVVSALVRDQDVQTAALQGIRRAHRLQEAAELHDLMLLAGLHAIRGAELVVISARHNLARARLARLHDNVDADGDVEQRRQLAEHLLSLWSLPGSDHLDLFREDPANDQPLDVAATVLRLLPVLDAATRAQVLLDGVRERVDTTARIHAAGNGSVRALMRGAANALDLDLGPIVHSSDRFWHAAPAQDRLRLRRPDSSAGRGPAIDPPTEYLGLEENPRQPAERGPHPREHAELFHYIRKGFDEALLEIRVRGIGERTVSPMIVNRDAGHGVGIFARVGDGQQLVFSEQGRVLLDGADITSRAYAWRGACFAATVAASAVEGVAASGAERDFVFADAASADLQESAASEARFVTMTPAASLDREAQLPGSGDSLPMPSIGVGKTRFAFFVQHGYFSASRPGAPPVSIVPGNDPFGSTPPELLQRMHLVTPRFGLGIADAAVFAGSGDAAAQVSLHWLEHQAYCVRVLIPERFRGYDDSDGVQVREQVGRALQRFRPAGIKVEVDFVEDQWVLGKAALPADDDDPSNALSRVMSGTLLWSASQPDSQP